MTEVTSVVAIMADIRTATYCAKGARKWWAARGWSWSDFVFNGIDADKLESTGDPMALRVAAVARARYVK